MTTDNRTLNFPHHGALIMAWRPGCGVEIELCKDPGKAPKLVINRREATLAELDALVDQLREVRYSLVVLGEIYGEGRRPALVEGPEHEEAPSEEGASVLVEGR